MTYDAETLAHLAKYGTLPEHIRRAEHAANQERDLQERVDFHNWLSNGGSDAGLSLPLLHEADVGPVRDEGPGEPVPSADEENARLREQLDAITSERDRLAEALDAATAPIPLPPNPEFAKLSEYGETGDGALAADDEVEDLIGKMKVDPNGADEAIKAMSAARRRLLTESFQQRLNELNNERLRGVKLNSFDAEWLEDRQTLVHKLAVLGDGG